MAWQVNREKAAERAQEIEQRQDRGGKIRWFKWQTGQPGNLIRFMPPGPDENKPPYIPDAEFAMIVYSHKRVPGLDKDTNFRCVGKTYPSQGPCPKEICMCAAMQDLKDFIGQNKEREDRILGTGQNKYYLSKQFWTNCINRKSMRVLDTVSNEVTELVAGQQPTDTQVFAPELIALPETVYKWALTNLDVVGDFTDPTSGMDAFILRTGTGRDTKYQTMTLVPDRRPIDVPAKVQMTLDAMYNVGEIFKYPDAATIDKMQAHVRTVQQFLGRSRTDMPMTEGSQQAATSGMSMGAGHQVAQTVAPAQQPTQQPVQQTAAATQQPAQQPAQQPQQAAQPAQSAQTAAPGMLKVKDQIASMLQAALNGEEPDCYFHQVIGWKKCQLCPWEAPCMDATQRAESTTPPLVTLETRKRIHGIA